MGCANKNIEHNKEVSNIVNYNDIAKYKNSKLPKIEIDISEIIKELKTDELQKNSCTKYIETKANFILNHGEQEYLSKKELNLIKKRAYFISKKLFDMRILLREKLTQFSPIKEKACLSSFRKAFRYSRFLEEFITELGISKYKDRAKAKKQDFSTNAYQFYKNNKYKDFKLKSGDVLLMMSSNFVSATIARIGDDDGQFSHGALVYVDKNNKTMVIESLISDGLIMTPYKEWKKHNHHSRTMLFRLYDSKKAETLANKFYNKTKFSYNNRKIIYDFHMNDRDRNELFCSEVIQSTYKPVGVPTYKTSFMSFKEHTFLKNLTITTEEVFAPSDIEIEPKFDLVAEWRNYDLTNETRMLDAIMTSVLKWLSKDNYHLKKTFRSSLGTNITYYARHYFGLFKDVPTNMPYTFLETIIKLNDVTNLLKDYLTDLNNQHIETYGYPMTYKKMIVALEKYKNIDYKKYISKQNFRLHKLIAPN
jgi:hypothetical protein